MQRVTAVLGAAMVFWATAAAAQDKPNFNGTWQLDAEKTAAANPEGTGRGGRRGGMMGPLTITVDGNTLTIQREGQRGGGTTTYKLDGSEQTVTMGGMGEAKAKAMWEGNTIVVETTRTVNDTPVTTKTVYAMEGEYLVISTTTPPRGGGEPITRKTYYKKS